MQTRQGNTLHSLRAVRDFIDAHTAELPGVTASGARKKLDAAITDLSTHVTDQSGGSLAAQSGTKRVQALRRALLRLHMTPISRVARVELPATQELTPLRVPRGRPSTERLVAAARGMAQAAEAHAHIFISAGLPLDFIAGLTAATDALLHAKDARKRITGHTVGATTGVSTRLREGRQYVSILDGLVRVELAGEPGLLSDWAESKRLPHARRSSATAASTPATSTPAASVTPIISVAQAA